MHRALKIIEPYVRYNLFLLLGFHQFKRICFSTSGPYHKGIKYQPEGCFHLHSSRSMYNDDNPG